jgi:hypothetical protein
LHTKLLLLTVLLLSCNAFASTICIQDCTFTGGGTGGSTLPQILEIFPIDGSGLFLDTAGLIILDSNVYDNLSNLTINSSTNVYIGHDSLPLDTNIPETFELNTLSYSGGLSITGLANDYVLLRQFYGDTELNLTAARGILVIDTNTTTVVPLSGSIFFMLSGLALLFTQLLRKNKI